MSDDLHGSAVERLAEVLDLIAAEGSHAYAKRIIGDMGIPRSSAYEIITRLVHAGYVSRLPCGGLRLGDELCQLGLSHLGLAVGTKRIRGALELLQEETQELAYLACLHDTRILVTHLYRSERAARTIIAAGCEFPVNWLSCGLLLLSNLSEDELSRFLTNNVRPSPTGEAPTNLRRLAEEVSMARRKRYVIEPTSTSGGNGSISAAVMDPAEACVATITLVLPAARMMHNIDSLLSRVRSAAMTIAAGLVQPHRQDAGHARLPLSARRANIL
jgi:IclR family transcriptional regulator, KDG regulon repressor